jgi:hypothetical protein
MRGRIVRFTAAFQALLLMGTLLVPALVAATGITTDLWVYQDGDTVTVTGADYGPNEVVDFVTTDPDGVVVDTGSASSDAAGAAQYQFVLHATQAGIYDVVGTGETSGLTAATQFDPLNKCVDVTPAAVGFVFWKVGAFTLNLAGSTKANGCNTAATAVTVEIRASDGLTGSNDNTTGTIVNTGPAVVSGTGWTRTVSFPSGSPADGKYDIRAVGSVGGTSCPTTSDYCGVANDYFGVDNNAPTAALSVTAGTLGSNGWYTSNVTVHTTGSDASGPTDTLTCTADQAQTSETTGATFSGQCTDLAGRVGNAAPLTIKLDKTNPTATTAVTVGTLGSNGWYTSDVTVHTSGTDAVSGIASCILDQAQTAETTGVTFNGTCLDNAGRTSANSAVTVKLDKTAPTANLAVTSGTLGANGWYISNVTVTASGVDAVSGVTCTAAQNLNAETTGVTVTGSCTNGAGMTTNAAPLPIKIDKTGPIVTLAVTAGTLGTNGWYTSDVTLHTNGTETISVPVSGCTADQVLNTNSAGTTFNGSCVDDAGITGNAAPQTIKLDKSAPISAVSTATGSAGAAAATGTASDVGPSGLNNGTPKPLHVEIRSVSCGGTLFAGSGMDLNAPSANWSYTAPTAPTAPGTYFVVSVATDMAGNVQSVAGCKSYTIASADSTPPVITKVVTGTAGTNGWYTSNVTVTWTVTDPESAFVINSGCGTQNFNSETAAATSSCSATSTGGTSSDSVNLKIDKTAPSSSLAVTGGTAGTNGWYTSNVTVATTGTDSISNPTVCTTDQFQTTETTGQAFNGSCTNDAGLTSNAAPLTVKLDKSAPSAALAVTAGTAGSNGWYTSDVTIGTSGSDAISGIAGCSVNQFQTVETASATFNGSCTNGAGLIGSAAPLSVKLDKTGPSASLAVTAGTPGANNWYTSNVTVSTSGSDSISDPTSCTGDQFQTTDTTSAGHDFHGSCTNDAGLSTSAIALNVRLDESGPTAVLSVTAGTAGLDGWYTSDVTVSTTGADDQGPVTCSVDQFQASETTGTVFKGSCTNDAGETTNAAPLTVKLDKTGPSATLAADRAPDGANGWYIADLTVSTTGTDSISNPTTCTPAQPSSTETADHFFAGSCTNAAGLTTNATELHVKLDKTGPSATLAADRAPDGAHGWYIADLTVSTTGSDSISNPTTCTAAQPWSTETADHAFAGSCTNDAGLVTNAPALHVKLDKTGPSATLTPTGTTGDNGWFTDDVTITTSGTDSISNPTVCTGVQSQTDETTGQLFSGSCTNDAGLSTDASDIAVKLDKTAPTSVVLTPAGTAGANGWFIDDVTITTSGADDISGIASCTAPQTQIAETAATTFYGHCTNFAGLTSNPDASDIAVKLDKTAPTSVVLTPAGTAGANGWFIDDVTITTSGADDISGIASCTAPQTQTAETAATAFYGHCTNFAGLTSNPDASVTVKLDKTAPSASLAIAAGTLGAHGWYTSDVTVSTTGSDSISDPTVCTTDQFQTTETTGQAFNGHCTNNAGLSTNAAPLTVKLDKTGPSASLVVTAGMLGAHGWYTSNVTVSTSGADSISDPTVCSVDQSQTSETTGTVFNGSCTNDAGLSTDAAPLTVKLDKTGPSAALAADRTPDGANGWYIADLTVSTSGTDSISNPTTCTAAQPWSTETADHAFAGSCTNDAGLTTNATALHLKLDKTGPSATLTASGTAGLHGWFIGDVSITTTGADSISDPTVCSGAQSQTTETTGQVFTGHCTNNAGISTNAAPLTVKLDKTGPSASLAVTAGTLGAHGWYTSNVTVGTTGTDSISSPTTCTGSQFQTTETIGQVFNGSCTNDAGLSTNAAPLTIKLDKTGPSAALAVTAGTPGNSGWYTTNVTISASGSDSIGNPTTCSADQFQTTETTGTAFNGTCTNDAGLSTSAAALTVKLDKTNPSVAITSPSTGLITVATWVAVSGTDGDTPSGIATVTVNGLSSELGSGTFSAATVPLNSCGANSITATATDQAGRTSTSSITVTRVCTGSLTYYQPIDQSTGTAKPIINTGKFGRVIPVKVTGTLSLGGTPVSITDTVLAANGLTLRIGVNGATCSNGDPTDSVETYADAGNANDGTNIFRYSSSQWIYNLDTGHAPSVVMTIGACYRLDVYLQDAGGHQVLVSTGPGVGLNPYAIFQPTK